ncbi:MAG: homoserine kinase [Gammaproteobacteria bacterium]|nr:homoserine kinase [Gammaproteobacteria bacterium]
MSVYTVLTLEEVQAFAQRFNFTVSRITPIQNGIENSNYFVELDDGRELVLTLFEELSKNEAEVLSRLMLRLFAQGLPVAVPLADLSDVYIHTLVGKPAQFAPRLAGSSPICPTLAQVTQMGAALAQLHLALENDPLPEEQIQKSGYSPAWWEFSKNELKPTLPETDQQLLEQVFDQFFATKQRYPDLPQGLIHGDLFRDNTLFVGDELSAILDFTTVTHDDWLMDIAIMMNDFCTNYPDVDLNKERVDAFITAYESVRRLTKDERLALPVFLAMAACRFWMSRLQTAIRNRTENRVNEDVLEKDPNEMRRMVVDRLGCVEE